MKPLTLLTMMALAAAPLAGVEAQTVHVQGAGGQDVTIDSRGVHTPTADITNGGVRSGGGSVTVRHVVRRGRVGATRAAAATGGEVAISGSGAHRAVDCGGGALSVSGSRNVLSVRNCSRVAVSGSDNRLTAVFKDHDSLSLTGTRNDVGYTLAAGAALGEMSNPGTGNTVHSP